MDLPSLWSVSRSLPSHPLFPNAVLALTDIRQTRNQADKDIRGPVFLIDLEVDPLVVQVIFPLPPDL